MKDDGVPVGVRLFGRQLDPREIAMEPGMPVMMKVPTSKTKKNELLNVFGAYSDPSDDVRHIRHLQRHARRGLDS